MPNLLILIISKASFLPAGLSLIISLFSYFMPKQGDFAENRLALTEKVLQKRVEALRSFLIAYERKGEDLAHTEEKFQGKDFFARLDTCYDLKLFGEVSEKRFYSLTNHLFYALCFSVILTLVGLIVVNIPEGKWVLITKSIIFALGIVLLPYIVICIRKGMQIMQEMHQKNNDPALR